MLTAPRYVYISLFLFLITSYSIFFFFFFFNDTATTEISTLPLHDALPISRRRIDRQLGRRRGTADPDPSATPGRGGRATRPAARGRPALRAGRLLSPPRAGRARAGHGRDRGRAPRGGLAGARLARRADRRHPARSLGARHLSRDPAGLRRRARGRRPRGRGRLGARTLPRAAHHRAPCSGRA